MKIPRDLSASDLIQLLKKFGYTPTRQAGSHIRLSSFQVQEHHITIPNHSPIKIGTLSSIFQDLAEHLKLSKQEFVSKLFEKK